MWKSAMLCAALAVVGVLAGCGSDEKTVVVTPPQASAQPSTTTVIQPTRDRETVISPNGTTTTTVR